MNTAPAPVDPDALLAATLNRVLQLPDPVMHTRIAGRNWALAALRLHSLLPTNSCGISEANVHAFLLARSESLHGAFPRISARASHVRTPAPASRPCAAACTRVGAALTHIAFALRLHAGRVLDAAAPFAAELRRRAAASHAAVRTAAVAGQNPSAEPPRTTPRPAFEVLEMLLISSRTRAAAEEPAAEPADACSSAAAAAALPSCGTLAQRSVLHKQIAAWKAIERSVKNNSCVMQDPAWLQLLDDAEPHALPAGAAAAAPPTAARAVYTAAPLGPSTGVDAMQLIHSPPSPADAVGVMQDACSDVPAAVNKLQKGQTLLVAMGGPGSQPLNEYAPEYPLLAYATRFNNGTGEKPEGMSMNEWTLLQLQRFAPSDDSLAQDATFILSEFNMRCRRDVNHSVGVQCSLTPDAIEEIGNQMTPQQLAETVRIMAKGARGAEYAKLVHTAPPVVQKMLRAARSITARTLGSAAEAHSLRSRQMGVWEWYGPPSISLTLNPAAISTPQFFRLVAVPYGFDPDGAPNLLPPALERWRLVSGSPVSDAQVFLAFLEAFFRVFLGWPPGAPRQADPNCLFGRVESAFMKPETNQRGGLHAHGCVWQFNMRPERLREALTTEQGQAAVLAFMESVQTQWLPGELQDAPEHDVAAQREPRAGEALQHVRSPADDKPSIQFWRLPLDSSSKAQRDHFAAMAVLGLLLHTHRQGTCTAAGVQPTHSNCRMGMPRLPNRRSKVKRHGHAVYLMRRSPTLVSYLLPLLLAHPCNHNAYFVCEVGRWARDVAQWKQTHPLANPGDPSRPRMPTLEHVAGIVAEYALKYATKAENLGGALGALSVADSIFQRMHAKLGDPASTQDQPTAAAAAAAPLDASASSTAQPLSDAQRVALQTAALLTSEQPALARQDPARHPARRRALRSAEGRYIMASTVNNSTSQQVTPAPLAALLLLNGGNSLETQRFVPLDRHVYAHALLPGPLFPSSHPDGDEPVAQRVQWACAAAEPSHASSLVEPPAAATTTTIDSSSAGASSRDNTLVPVWNLTDYMHRGEQLRDFSPMMLLRHYRKVRSRCSTDFAPRAVRTSHSHSPCACTSPPGTSRSSPPPAAGEPQVHQAHRAPPSALAPPVRHAPLAPRPGAAPHAAAVQSSAAPRRRRSRRR